MGSRRKGKLSEHLETLFQAGAIGGLSDAQLLELFVDQRDGSGASAFRALVERHGPMVLRVCRSVLHNPDDTEDAFQVTFLALARRAGSIRKHGSVASWLHGTAHRVAIKARTAARRRLARESRAAEKSMSGESYQQPETGAVDVTPILHEEIERLPAKYRAPIVLCYLEGMTQDRAAVELGWPAGTVRGRLARARNLLKSRLTRRGVALPAGLAAATVGAAADAAAIVLPAALIEATVGAAIGRSTAGRVSRAAIVLLRAIQREMTVARWLRLAAPIVLIGGLAGTAAVFLHRGGIGMARDRGPLLRIAAPTRPAGGDLAGDPLPDGALARLGTTRFSAGTTIQQVAYSRDGRLLASIDGNGDLDLWEAATGRRRFSIALTEKNGLRIGGMAFAPDGRSLAVATMNQGIVLHDTADTRPIRRFAMKSQVHKGNAQVRGLAFAPSGNQLAAAFWDAPLTVWDASSGQIIRSFGDESKGLEHLAFSPDGRTLVSGRSAIAAPAPRPDRKTGGAEPSVLQVWDSASGQLTRRIDLGQSRIGAMAVSPGGETVAVAMIGQETFDGGHPGITSDRGIRLFRLADGREVRRLPGIDAMPAGLAFNSDGSRLASGETAITSGMIEDVPARLTMLHVWDVTTGQELRRAEVRGGGTMCLAFAPAGETLAWVAWEEHVIRFWNAADGQELDPVPGHRGAVGDAAFTPDGRTLVTVSEDRMLRFWDPCTGNLTRQHEAGDDRLWFVALSADGRLLATGGGLAPARLWDVASGREVRRFAAPGRHFTWCGDLSADGKTLATSRNEGVVFWDTATGTHRLGRSKPKGEPGMVKSLRFAPDGRTVAAVGGDWVRVWDVATAEETRSFALPNRGLSDGFMLDGARLTFSPDGATLAVTSERDGLVFLLDAASSRELGRLDGATTRFKALAFSPDGGILATGVDTGKSGERRELAIRLWDVAANREIGRVPAHRSYLRALAFSGDGRRLVSASEDGTALVWDVARIIGGNATVAAESRDSSKRRDGEKSRSAG